MCQKQVPDMKYSEWLIWTHSQLCGMFQFQSGPTQKMVVSSTGSVGRLEWQSSVSMACIQMWNCETVRLQVGSSVKGKPDAFLLSLCPSLCLAEDLRTWLTSVTTRFLVENCTYNTTGTTINNYNKSLHRMLHTSSTSTVQRIWSLLLWTFAFRLFSPWHWFGAVSVWHTWR